MIMSLKGGFRQAWEALLRAESNVGTCDGDTDIRDRRVWSCSVLSVALPQRLVSSFLLDSLPPHPPTSPPRCPPRLLFATGLANAGAPSKCSARRTFFRAVLVRPKTLPVRECVRVRVCVCLSYRAHSSEGPIDAGALIQSLYPSAPPGSFIITRNSHQGGNSLFSFSVFVLI